MPQDSRVDSTGLAYAGSQRQIQLYVNGRAEELSRTTAEALALAPELASRIKWVSPLEARGYAELRDAEFLDALGLARHAEALARFWPARGPRWDALATLDGARGCVLVEAKSHVAEIYADGCRADGPSLETIRDALEATKTWLGARTEADWMGSLYQSANRYAHLFFLRQTCAVNAYLLNVYFLGDRTIPEPASQVEWDSAIAGVKAQLGIKYAVPYSSSAFLEAIP